MKKPKNENKPLILDPTAVTIKLQTPKHFKFGIVSDNHLCNKYSRKDILNYAYDDFSKEGIEVVLNSGDVLDGEKMYRGQEYELVAHGAHAQARYGARHYPQIGGITTYMVGGNHPGSFWKRSGVDVMKLMVENRDDLVYLAPIEADLKVGPLEKTVIRLFHPGGGTAYALSYQPQKIVESYSGGDKPNMLILGHYHKSGYFFIRNVHSLMAGCTEDQTPFMRTKHIEAHRGYWKIDLYMGKKGGIDSLKTEFVPFYK